MRRVIKGGGQVGQIFFGRDPSRPLSLEIERSRVATQSFSAGPIGVFVEIRQGQFAHRAIDRIAPTQDGVIGFTDRAPITALSEKRHYMIIVALGLQIKQERFLAGEPQSDRGQKRPLKTVSFLFAYDPSWREVGLAPFFPIKRQSVEVILDLGRHGEPAQNSQLLFSQTEH